MDFTNYDPWEQVVINTTHIKQHFSKFISFSTSEWDGNEQWFGRGFGLTSHDHISRYIMSYRCHLTEITLYFDRQLTENWPADGKFRFQIYKESPAWGTNPAGNPPCDPPDGITGMGSKIIPVADGYQEIQLNDVVCFNHGLDPRNLEGSGALRHASFVTIPINAPLLPSDAVSFIAETSWDFPGGVVADVSAEIYFVGDE